MLPPDAFEIGRSAKRPPSGQLAARSDDLGLTDVIGIIGAFVPRQHTLMLPMAPAGNRANKLVVGPLHHQQPQAERGARWPRGENDRRQDQPTRRLQPRCGAVSRP